MICQGSPRGWVSLGRWLDWLEEKGYETPRRDGRDTDIPPCARLVAHNPRDERDFHWVYRDRKEGLCLKVKQVGKSALSVDGSHFN